MFSQRINEVYQKGSMYPENSLWQRIKRAFVFDAEYEKNIANYKMNNGNGSALLRLKTFVEKQEKMENFSAKDFECSLKDFYEIIQPGGVARSAMVLVQLKEEGIIQTEARVFDSANEVVKTYDSSLKTNSNEEFENTKVYVKFIPDMKV